MQVSDINLPDFLCIGAPKSGTSSLYEYLKKLNFIGLHKTIKGPNYLLFPELVTNSIKDLYKDKYKDLKVFILRNIEWCLTIMFLRENIEKNYVLGKY